jgi:hypothetical protein
MIWGMRGQVEVQVGCKIETFQSCVESPADVYLTSPEGELLFRKGDRRIGIREGLDQLADQDVKRTIHGFRGKRWRP